MAVLPDKKIKELIKNKKLRITNFKDKTLTPNGYDLLTEDFKLKPNEFKLVKSVEKIKLPNNLIAIPYLRTTYAFKGLILSPGVIDAGFEGRLIFSLYNSSKKTITLEKKENLKRAIHIVFFQISGKAKTLFGLREGEENNLI